MRDRMERIGCWFGKGEKQIPFGNDSKKGNCKSKSNCKSQSNCKSESNCNCRLPSGMTNEGEGRRYSDCCVALRMSFAALCVIGAALPGGLVSVSAQNVNPQPNFASQVMSANPSVYLNFDDAGTSFKDEVSGLSFSGSTAAIDVGYLAALSGGNSGGTIGVIGSPLPSGTITSVNYQANGASSTSQTLLVLSGTFPSLTIVKTYPITVAATGAAQHVAVSIPVNAGEYLGIWTAAGVGVGYGSSGATGVYYLTNQGTLPTGAATYASATGNYSIQAVLVAQSGSVLARQAGFDATQPDNTSAAFPYNGYSAAPNDTVGSVEWNVPYSLLVHVDRLQWNRTGSLVLASKGDVSGATSWWKLYLQMNGTTSQLCFSRSGGGAVNGICTNGGFDAMPNGLNYDVIVTDAGTGAPGGNYCAGCTSPLSLYINGLGPATIPETPTSGSFASGFGYVTFAVSGGTGYANVTNFTATGGGATCQVTGVMLATNGVPTSAVSGTGSNNFGCTSAPAITLVSPTGTGAVVTATPANSSMNSSSSPLMVPGYMSGGTYYGVAGGTMSQTPTYMDEAAMFPGVLSQNEIAQLFYQTKFYQGLMKASVTPPLVIFSDDGCQDTDNFFALSALIKAHLLGAVKVIGVEDVQGGGTSPAFYRQELDQAGLSHVPVSVSATFAATASSCPAANLTAFDASTPQSTAAYETSVTMYRTLFARYATEPIFVTTGGSMAGMVEFMQSPADGISSMTGTQLWAQNAATGGAVYGQGLGVNYSFGAYYDGTSSMYMFNNNMPMPMYWFGGTPQQAGPGVLESRTAKDPLWMVFHSLGAETRPCWDCLMVANLVSSAFSGGVNVGIGGSGTGYANSTPFTSTGGGPNCVVTGTMVAVNGVPSGILSAEGTALNTATGIGTGCLTAGSPPTIVLTNPTGTGAVLTASTTASACGTITQTSGTNGVTSQASCTNQYFVPYSLNVLPGATPVFEWFINSMDDPTPVGSPRRQ